MRILKHIINWTVWTLLCLYALLLVAVQLPQSQHWLGKMVSQTAGEKLGTKVSIGRVDLGFLNRLILDDVVILDQRNHVMLKAARLTARVDLAPMALGRISISSAQVFSARLRLSRLSATAPLNCQFVIDSLASADTTSASPLNLRINSLIMRHSAVSYHVFDAPYTPNLFNPRHISLSGISSHIILKTLTADSININIKRLTCMEQSGINLQRLSLYLEAGRRQATMKHLRVQLPATCVQAENLTASYNLQRFRQTLTMSGRLHDSYITPSDLQWLATELRPYKHSIAVEANLSYHDEIIKADNVTMKSNDGQLTLAASCQLNMYAESKPWTLAIDRLFLGQGLTNFVSTNIYTLPAPVLRLGNIALKGDFSGNMKGALIAMTEVKTDLGELQASVRMTEDKQFTATATTNGINLGELSNTPLLGLLAAHIEATGTLQQEIAAKASIAQIDYRGNSYQNILLDGGYGHNHIAGHLQVNDPKMTALVDVDISGKSLNDAVGTVSLRQLSLPQYNYQLAFLRLESGFDEGRHYLVLNSDFAHAKLIGEFDYTTLAQSVANAIGTRLPTLPAMPPLTKTTNNNFTLNLNIAKTDWLQRLLSIDLDVSQPLSFIATVNDRNRHIKVDLHAPAFRFNNSNYERTSLNIDTPNDTLTLRAAASSVTNGEQPLDLTLQGHAADNKLQFALNWQNNNPDKPVHGVLNAVAQLYQNVVGQSEAQVTVLPSKVFIDNSVWQVEPSDILYCRDRLLVDHFTVHNGQQHITIDGIASSHHTDSLVANLKGVEVAYILDLVNFDAVTFAGQASGQAYITSTFGDPHASATLKVDNFKFQDGRMGTLTALVEWNKQQKQIDINATAHDGPEATTFINGYVSPERDFIDLGIAAHGTYLEFMHSFTESFISHINGHGQGKLRLAGPLSAINLTGGLKVSGEATITPLNTTYQLRDDTLTFVPNHIRLNHQPIYDRLGNVAYLTGSIDHQDLTNLSLELHVDTDRFLAYDFNSFGEQAFYGNVFVAGDVDIRMKGDNVNIDCNVTPLKNTVFVYNAAQTDAIASQEFLTFTQSKKSYKQQNYSLDHPIVEGTGGKTNNIYMTFLVNTTPEATLRLLMDARTGDYITLNGNGIIQASYYNKGAFQMQGTYTIDNGTYDITIQNIINKKFQFLPGGTIVFGGDPYDAALSMQAMYTVNGVSLSDLNIGNSFSSNTVRINCLMNIGGKPSAPQITFDLDMPNVNADEKQMVRSLLSSQQEMNQQVLYLLGIGRFYSQGQNNSSQQQGQTSLAMNSFLSGTLSTQINNVINQIVKNDDWNFGANISTGTEGWNNAEYEGIVNGRMFNNRLLINGQFGYRDNATQTNPSFIGDFDVRYLLTPSGNYALKVYNQTNDRYFTRSSLNTQGVGIIIKRDFNGIYDFFGLKNAKK